MKNEQGKHSAAAAVVDHTAINLPTHPAVACQISENSDARSKKGATLLTCEVAVANGEERARGEKDWRETKCGHDPLAVCFFSCTPTKYILFHPPSGVNIGYIETWPVTSLPIQQSPARFLSPHAPACMVEKRKSRAQMRTYIHLQGPNPTYSPNVYPFGPL